MSVSDIRDIRDLPSHLRNDGFLRVKWHITREEVGKCVKLSARLFGYRQIRNGEEYYYDGLLDHWKKEVINTKCKPHVWVRIKDEKKRRFIGWRCEKCGGTVVRIKAANYVKITNGDYAVPWGLKGQITQMLEELDIKAEWSGITQDIPAPLVYHLFTDLTHGLRHILG